MTLTACSSVWWTAQPTSIPSTQPTADPLGCLSPEHTLRCNPSPRKPPVRASVSVQAPDPVSQRCTDGGAGPGKSIGRRRSENRPELSGTDRSHATLRNQAMPAGEPLGRRSVKLESQVGKNQTLQKVISVNHARAVTQTGPDPLQVAPRRIQHQLLQHLSWPASNHVGSRHHL